MDRRDGGATSVCASGGGGPQCGSTDAGGGVCEPEGLSQGLSNYYNSPGRLAFRRKFESVTRRTGVDPATFATEILAIWGYGHLHPKPDGPGQVYCGPTELWAAMSPRQCSYGYANPGDSGSLPGVGESFGAEERVSPMNWPGLGTFGDVR